MITFDAMRLREMVRCWSLMAVMALAIAPRVYLHHCELAHEQHTSTGAKLKAHCDVCDEVAPVQAVQQSRTLPSLALSDIKLSDALPSVPFLRHEHIQEDRGPPVLG